MGRNLPWAIKSHKNTPAVKARTSSTKDDSVTIKRSEVIFDREKNADQVGFAAVSARRKRALSRSPSSSPPPGIPPVSPMKSGYDNDDAYIMVEDELYSIAQSYTAHLHRAEYKRLMRKARDAPPQELSDVGSSRPRNIKDNVDRMNREHKQKTALERMTTNPSTIGAGGGDSDSEGSDQDERPNKISGNAQRGVSLAGLMTTSSQAKVSLVGLERLPSSSRAARGYAKEQDGDGDEDTARPKRTVGDIFVAAQQRRQPRLSSRDQAKNNQKQFTGTDQSGVRSNNSGNGQLRSTQPLRNVEVSTADRQTNGSSMAKATSLQSPATTKMKRSLVDDLEDDLDDDINADSNDAHNVTPKKPARETTSTPATKQRQQHPFSKPDPKKDKKSRLDEVPFFMF